MSSLVDLAERVSAVARSVGVESALIGALAMSVHRYIRATEDADLATAVELPMLRKVVEALHADGLKATLRTPDEDDELGGVITVWIREDEDGDPIEPVEIVNFVNPWRPRRNPATEGVRTSTLITDTAGFSSAGILGMVGI